MTFGYNTANEQILRRDQNGSVHEYAYDNFGRVLSDTVTTLGTGVDETVRKIATEYNITGQAAAVTSLDGNNNMVNHIVYTYDENGLLQREYTSHSGEVDTAFTPFIEYEYDTAKTSGIFINALHPVSVTYPSGKEITYQYDDYGRSISINEDNTPLVEYAYQGLGSILRTNYVEPNLTLDYTTSGALDKFGRIADHAWKNAANQDVVRIKLDYDLSGNRLNRQDMINPDWSETYTYDGLNQIKSMQRVGHSEAWNFDETGNWIQYNRNGSVENRTHNTANEIQSLVSHDKNGNMTVMPISIITNSSISLSEVLGFKVFLFYR